MEAGGLKADIEAVYSYSGIQGFTQVLEGLLLGRSWL